MKMAPLFWIISLFCVAGGLARGASEPTPATLEGQWIRVPITAKEVTEGRAWTTQRQLIEQAITAKAAGMVFDIQVGSGNPQAALSMAEEIARLKIKTVAYVNPTALAGGALVALACDEVWMAPGSRIGAAAPEVTLDKDLPEAAQEARLADSLAILKAGARSLCKLKGHRPDLAEAFIDRNKELQIAGRVLSPKGELLVLDADDAAQVIDNKPLLSSGTVPDADNLVSKKGSSKKLVALNASLFTKPAAPATTASSPVATPASSSKSAETIPAVVRKDGRYRGKVVVIPVGKEDLVSPARFEFRSRTLKQCDADEAEAVIFNLDTPGGLVWETTELMMSDLQRLKARSFAFVNPRALSAGAMVAVATDAIYMAPASSIGAATPINPAQMDMGEAERAKMNSAVLAMARTVAKEKGHDFRVIEAMIDNQRGLTINGEVLCQKGELLTLDAQQATMLFEGKPLLAKATVSSLEEIQKAENLKGELITAEPVGFEQIAIWVTQYASILILIGVAAGYLEMQTPGFGLPGFVAIAAFSIFFFGHYVAGSLVGQETAVVAAIFIIGVMLIAAEFMLFPGTIIPGLLGFICVMVALVYTMSGWETVAPAVPTVTEETTSPFTFNLTAYALGLRNFAIGITGAIVVILILIRVLPETRPFRHLVLDAAAGGSLESTPAMATVRTVKVGDTGLTRSALRPYGTVEVGDSQLEAMVEGGYLQAGVSIRVREVQGPKVIVEAHT